MEVWKNIPNYVGIYMIINLGRIESLERKVKNGNGYIWKYYENKEK